ncbi:MAG: hypothetical protein IGS03_06555 [Candidatus Sericytochromatia bacterium]|nr:hypothetical protein [Candidatus Sericytochromatia bacterium]
MKTSQPFNSVLIANRGAIARRIARSCKMLGLKVIMVYSSDDCHPALLELADQVCEIPAGTQTSGYMHAEALIARAAEAGAAIHPGYGFLSEQAAFARSCQAAGVPWIGPSPHFSQRCVHIRCRVYFGSFY